MVFLDRKRKSSRASLPCPAIPPHAAYEVSSNINLAKLDGEMPLSIRVIRPHHHPAFLIKKIGYTSYRARLTHDRQPTPIVYLTNTVRRGNTAGVQHSPPAHAI
jgi:hypothetical protein